MSKISELSDGGVIQGGDTLIAVRSGGNVKVTYGGSTTANIDGGTIDGTVIGGTTPAAGTFTSLTASGDVNFDSNTLFVDASANAVGIGVSTPAAPLSFGSITNDARIYLRGNTNEFAIGTNGLQTVYAGYGGHVFETGSFGGAEAMRIDSSGNLLVGTTVLPATMLTDGYSGFVVDGANDYIVSSRFNDIAAYFKRENSDGSVVAFYRDGTSVGTISVTTSATTYLTSSDQRLKENIADADDAGSKIDAIKVRQYDWKVDGSHQDYGMVAQELMTVAPEAVSGDPESDEMMGVDYSKLVPMLIKEVQSLRARVAQLEGAN
jgi:hypothetical protein